MHCDIVQYNYFITPLMPINTYLHSTILNITKHITFLPNNKMSSLTRVWMAAGVALVNGHTDQGCKLKSLIKSVRHSKKAFTSSSGAEHSDLRPFSSILGAKVDGGGNKKTNSDDSLRQVMYLSCWGPS
ncbi:unnamed protein product [Lactuca saligna]|uniref:Uncharacterized protein n=1 Tax=Lactuca saligna TaxID=75948 RepID=A0AA36DXV6_LACSI|nr:unnamed protein product [Lactuca saligna]